MILELHRVNRIKIEEAVLDGILREQSTATQDGILQIVKILIDAHMLSTVIVNEGDPAALGHSVQENDVMVRTCWVLLGPTVDEELLLGDVQRADFVVRHDSDKIASSNPEKKLCAELRTEPSEQENSQSASEDSEL